MVYLIRCSFPISGGPIDLKAGTVLEQYAADKDVMKGAEIYNPITVVAMVAKIVLLHQMQKKYFFESSPITFGKPLLKALSSSMPCLFAGT